MRNKQADKYEKSSANKAQTQKEKQSPQYETMSQRQNRHGKGRQQNGSDGSGDVASGSNH